ncbi:MAG TPA: hypothetical protein VGN72_19640 [Tepidisphaeraceae bacterium]|jgi:hypothetical protein|nr:hypothetical protein [Tepidisphaeraceae bacterium]
MAKEFGPYYAPGYVAVYNPAMPGQVRQVSGAGSPAWVTESATFTECRIALVQVGATGVYYADIPAGLTFDRDYSVGVYDAAATTFSQALSAETYGPDVSPANVTQIAGQTANAAAPVTFPASLGTSTLTIAQLSRSVYGNGSVTYVEHDGNALTSGEALRLAIESATNRSTVVTGPGTFRTTETISIPAGVRVVGQGRTETIIESDVLDAGTGAPCFVAESGTVLEGLQIVTVTTTGFDFPYTRRADAADARPAILRNAWIRGRTDCVYVKAIDVAPPAYKVHQIIEDCILDSGWDAIFSENEIDLTVRRTICRITGAASIGGNHSMGIGTNSASIDFGAPVWTFEDCVVLATATVAGSTATAFGVQDAVLDLHLHGTSVMTRSDGGAGAVDIKTTGALVYVSGSAVDSSKLAGSQYVTFLADAYAKAVEAKASADLALRPTTPGRKLDVDASGKSPATIATGDMVDMSPTRAQSIESDALSAATSALTAATHTTTLVGRITDALFSGMTSLPNWMRAIVRSSAPDATAAGEINAGGGTFDATSDSVEAIGTAVGQLSVSGTGARTVTVVVTDGDEQEIEAANVRFSRPGETRSATTNDQGIAIFGLDDATWMLSVTAVGFTYVPTSQPIGANATITVVMTAQTITVAADPELIIGTLTTYDRRGAVQPRVAITFRLIATVQTGVPEPGRSFPTAPYAETSDANGLLQAPVLRGARYAARRGDGKEIEFAVPTDGESFPLNEILGGLRDGQTI